MMVLEKASSRNPKGFTFTLSIILLSMSLITLAAFSQDYRKEYSAIFSGAKASGSAQASERISIGLADLLGVYAGVHKENATRMKSEIGVLFPFEKEGFPLLDFNAYSASLPYTMRGAGIEPIITLGSGKVSDFDAVTLGGHGSVRVKNDGAYDVVSYLHPPGWPLQDVSIDAECSGNITELGEFYPVPTSRAGPGEMRFSLNIIDGTGSVFHREVLSAKNTNASISALFEGGGSLFFHNIIGPANYTQVYYAKSPGAALILPFDVAGAYSDYSPDEVSVSASGSPAWGNSDCVYGGCIEFDGVDDSLTARSFQFTESPVIYLPGPQRTKNGGFEDLATGVPDDSNPDTWTSWSITNADANISYRSTTNSYFGRAINISRIGGMKNDSRIVQSIYNIWPNSQYTLIFFSRGDGSNEGRYRVRDITTGKFVSHNQWLSGIHNLSTGYAGTTFEMFMDSFNLPLGSTGVTIDFLPPAANGYVLYDTALLYRTGQLNGNFEYFYYENGTSTPLPEPESSLTQRPEPLSCQQKACSSPDDCTGGDAPYCDGGCNPLTGTCYPNIKAKNYCRSLGEPCPDTPTLSACGLFFCNSTSLVAAKKSAGSACTVSLECPYNAPHCAEDLGVTECRTCIPERSATYCSSNAQCCGASGESPGICNMGMFSNNFATCLSCLPLYGRTCISDSDCCPGEGMCRAGMCVPNSAPSAPNAPVISPSSANSSYLISCVRGCPPTPLPSDPESDSPLSVQYRWYKNGVSLTSYWHNRTGFRCSENSSCIAGDEITLRLRVCDQSDSCSSASGDSNPVSIISAPPVSCNGVGASCSVVSSCCTGLACIFEESGAPSGYCKIPSAETWNCTLDSDCASGICSVDDSGRGKCVSSLSCGQACADSAQCGSGCGHCVSNGTEDTCAGCIPLGSSAECATNPDCCLRENGRNGLCDPSSNLCVSCIGEGEACSSQSDCCEGACQLDESSILGTRVCTKSPGSPAKEGGKCATDSDCEATLFCDTLNRYQTKYWPEIGENDSGFPQNGYGQCIPCYRVLEKCENSHSCCSMFGIRFKCQGLSAAEGVDNSNSICVPNATFSPVEVFYNWGKVGNGYFDLVNNSTDPDHIHRDTYAIKIWGNESSYIYNNVLPGAIRGDRTYLVDFWTTSEVTTSGLRFAVYDQFNQAYLDADGNWQFGSEITIDTNYTELKTLGEMTRYRMVFDTLPDAKVQLRFYNPRDGLGHSGVATYIDDLAVTELHDFAMSVWLKPQGAGQVFYQMASEPPAQQGINWSFTSDRNLTISFASAVFSDLSGSMTDRVVFPDNGWHQVTFSANRHGEYYIYLDGQLYTQGTSTDVKITRGEDRNDFYIGGDGSSKPFTGSMDELRIYKRALSADEALRLFQGNFQSPCSVKITSTYEGDAVQSASTVATYGAGLKIRKLHSSCTLSMPFDTDTDSGAVGAIPDYSPSLAYGTLYGATWDSGGKSGGAFHFINSGDRIVSSGPIISGSGDFSISLWVKPSALTGTMHVAGNKDSANAGGVALKLVSGNPVLEIGGSSITSALGVSSTTEWTHIVASRENGVASIYVNTLLGRNATLAGAIGSSSKFSIGNSEDGASDQFAGSIDEVRAYSQALSASDIEASYSDTSLVYSANPPASPPSRFD